MNANDLANTLETLITNPNNGEIVFHIDPIKEIIATLRQQADRIVELEKQVPDWENIRKPNQFFRNLYKECPPYKMGDIDWTKALK
jgi:LDH2 family malate/lactate/ureidoglycolate dehydrogenase